MWQPVTFTPAEIKIEDMREVRMLRALYGQCRASGYKNLGLKALRDAVAIRDSNRARFHLLMREARETYPRARNIDDVELAIQAALANR